MKIVNIGAYSINLSETFNANYSLFCWEKKLVYWPRRATENPEHQISAATQAQESMIHMRNIVQWNPRYIWGQLNNKKTPNDPPGYTSSVDIGSVDINWDDDSNVNLEVWNRQYQ